MLMDKIQESDFISALYKEPLDSIFEWKQEIERIFFKKLKEDIDYKVDFGHSH